MNIRWVVQTNLGSGKNAQDIIAACKKIGVEVVGVEPIPFDTKLPEMPHSDKETIYYGSTNFIKNAYGIHPNFNVDQYKKAYGSHFLNSDAEFMTFESAYDSMVRSTLLADNSITDATEYVDTPIFIRPCEDIKEFPGQVTTRRMFMEWAEKILNLSTDECVYVNGKTNIIVSPVRNVMHEWRLFMVNGKYSTGSYYRSLGRGVFIDWMPSKVIEFAERMSALWTPDDIFVMDVAEVDGSLYVIECNGWNSCGLYKSDIQKLVSDITTFKQEKQNGKD